MNVSHNEEGLTNPMPDWSKSIFDFNAQCCDIRINLIDNQKIKNNGNKQQCRKPSIRDSISLARGEARNKTISASPRSL